MKQVSESKTVWPVGYARVSTDDQNLDLQRDALGQAGCSQIYEEQASGKNTDRPQLEACLKALRPGDTLVVWRLDRLGRSLPDLVRIITALEGRGIGFESLSEKIDTGSATGRLFFHMFAALAEFERNLIRERTAAGLAAARARGRRGGRPQKLSQADRAMIVTLMSDRDAKPSEVARRFGIGRTTLYRILAEEKSKA
jgi:DNA invertase Pin-like site-specific DNA recombinase